MDASADLCPKCGATHAGGCPCSGVEVTERESGIRLLPQVEESVRNEGPPEARLIREFKGSTVEDLLLDDGDLVQRLPGQVCRLADAIDAAEYQYADQILDDAIGSLLHGPGFRRRRELRLLQPLLAILFLALVTATVILWIA